MRVGKSSTQIHVDDHGLPTTPRPSGNPRRWQGRSTPKTVTSAPAANAELRLVSRRRSMILVSASNFQIGNRARSALTARHPLLDRSMACRSRRSSTCSRSFVHQVQRLRQRDVVERESQLHSLSASRARQGYRGATPPARVARAATRPERLDRAGIDRTSRPEDCPGQEQIPSLPDLGLDRVDLVGRHLADRRHLAVGDLP